MRQRSRPARSAFHAKPPVNHADFADIAMRDRGGPFRICCSGLLVADHKAPAAMQQVELFDSELNKALGDPIFIRRPRDVGPATTPLTAEAFGEFIKRDAAGWAELVKPSGAQTE